MVGSDTGVSGEMSLWTGGYEVLLLKSSVGRTNPELTAQIPLNSTPQMYRSGIYTLCALQNAAHKHNFVIFDEGSKAFGLEFD